MDDIERRDEDVGAGGGLDRRTLLKRGAVVGGAAVWATPIVQSLAQPAFAAGSRLCVRNVRFKWEPGKPPEASFDGGIPAPGSEAADCLPPGYGTDTQPIKADGGIPDHPGEFVVINLLDSTKATISLPLDCVLLYGNAKAGAKENRECVIVPAGTEVNGRNVYTVDLAEKDISFIAGVICCS